MKKSLFLFLSLWAGILQAEIVKYVINGQLNHMTDRDHYHQADIYNLDGAYYTREMTVNTSIPASHFYSGTSTYWIDSPGFLVSNIYHITGRPNGAPDLYISASIISTIMIVQNAYSVSADRYYDAVALGGSRMTGELENLNASDEWIYFIGDFIPGDNGYVTEPPYSFDNTDIESFNANIWRFAGTNDGKDLNYKQTILSASASPFSILPCPDPGDMNGDGDVDLGDLLLLQRHLLGY